MVGNSKWDFYFIETKAHSYFATRNKISQIQQITKVFCLTFQNYILMQYRRMQTLPVCLRVIL